MTYKSSAQLKSQARGQLLGKYRIVVPATLLVAVLSYCISLIASSFVSTDTTIGLLINFIISFFVEIVTGIFVVGQIIMNLNIICNKPYFISDIYYGFHNQTNKIIILKFLLTIAEVIAALPFLICITILQINFSYTVMSIALLTFIPALLITMLIQLNLSISYYILVDFPDYSLQDILKLSIKNMKGSKGRLLYLFVSFIPMFLLGVLPFGIGLLWVVPYYRMTMTDFYLDLVSVKNQ